MGQPETTGLEALLNMTMMAVAGHVVYWLLSNLMTTDENQKTPFSKAFPIPKLEDGFFLFTFGIFMFYAMGLIHLTFGLMLQLFIDLPEYWANKFKKQ